MKTDESARFATRRTFGILVSLVATAALAQQPYPGKPVTIVVPFSPGGDIEIGARCIAQKLTAKWGQTVIVVVQATAKSFPITQSRLNQ